MVEMSYAKMRNNFEEKYFNEVVPALEVFEDERKNSFTLALLSAIPLILIGIVSSFFVYKYKNGLKLSITLIILGIGAYHVIKKNFENKLKEKVMPTICSCFENLIWTKIPPNSMDDGIYKRINLIPDYNTIESDDCFKGSYNDTGYSIEEFHAIRGYGKNRSIVFKGAVVTIKMHKSFSGRTVIASNSLFHHSPSKDLHHTELEDIEFEKRFDVYTDDDVEARYLITPSLMERLNNMKLAFNAETISVAFNNAKIYIALHTGKDLFSIGSLKKQVCDYEQFKTMFEEIYSIVRLIDYFKLDQKTGL